MTPTPDPEDSISRAALREAFLIGLDTARGLSESFKDRIREISKEADEGDRLRAEWERLERGMTTIIERLEGTDVSPAIAFEVRKEARRVLR